MTKRQIVGADGKPAGAFMHECLATEAGRLTFLYILSQLKLFEPVQGGDDLALRNAALAMLRGAEELTGFALDINLIR
jgi:hypothetical protein